MIRILQFLFFGHVHKWQETSRRELFLTRNGARHLIGERVFCKCETCGKPEKFDLD